MKLVYLDFFSLGVCLAVDGYHMEDVATRTVLLNYEFALDCLLHGLEHFHILRENDKFRELVDVDGLVHVLEHGRQT